MSTFGDGMESRFTFSRAEKLKQKRLFDQLFRGAQKKLHHPVLAIWQVCELPEPVPAQVGFSVPKKHFKKAVQRNQVKRRLREAYRLNNSSLHHQLNSNQTQIAVLFVTLKTNNTSFDHLQEKMVLLLQDIEAELKRGH